MATLYELTEEAGMLIDMLENGEIDEQVLDDTLEAMCVDEKIEDCCKVYRQFEADKDAYKEEKDFYEKKRKTAENGAERIKQTIARYLVVVGKKEIKAGNFKVKHTSPVSVEVLDIEKLGLLYKIEQPYKPDKRAIAQAIKAGEEVEGAVLVTRDSCQIK